MPRQHGRCRVKTVCRVFIGAFPKTLSSNLGSPVGEGFIVTQLRIDPGISTGRQTTESLTPSSVIPICRNFQSERELVAYIHKNIMR